jgi:hypothetical protein
VSITFEAGLIASSGPRRNIPVELKKSARPPSRAGAYPNHMIHALAYIVLMREHYGEPVHMAL